MPEAENQPKSYQCRHILTSGQRCRSASLRGENFCYYHHTTRHPRPQTFKTNPKQAIFELPSPDDRASIQFALAQVLTRIAYNQIDAKRASLLLYGLQIATHALPKEPRPTAPSSHRGRSGSDYLNPRETERAARASGPVEDIVLDFDHGPIAPIAEVTDPEKSSPRHFSDLVIAELEERIRLLSGGHPLPENPDLNPNPADPDPEQYPGLNPDHATPTTTPHPNQDPDATLPILHAVAASEISANGATTYQPGPQAQVKAP